MRVRSSGWVALLSLLVFAGCNTDDGYARAAQRAASTVGVAANDLRVTERTELSTARHAVFRISERRGQRLLTVAVSSRGAVVDSATPDAFTALAAAEDLGARFGELGPVRVAGWFGAFGGGKCGEPLARDIHVTARADGGHELTYAFAGTVRVEQCDLVLDGHGRVESVRVRPSRHES